MALPASFQLETPIGNFAQLLTFYFYYIWYQIELWGDINKG